MFIFLLEKTLTRKEMIKIHPKSKVCLFFVHTIFVIKSEARTIMMTGTGFFFFKYPMKTNVTVMDYRYLFILLHLQFEI